MKLLTRSLWRPRLRNHRTLLVERITDSDPTRSCSCDGTRFSAAVELDLRAASHNPQHSQVAVDGRTPLHAWILLLTDHLADRLLTRLLICRGRAEKQAVS